MQVLHYLVFHHLRVSLDTDTSAHNKGETDSRVPHETTSIIEEYLKDYFPYIRKRDDTFLGPCLTVSRLKRTETFELNGIRSD